MRLYSMEKKSLLQLRKENKVKQKELMELLKTDRKTIYNWEHCRTAPDHWQIQTLCKFYGIKKSALKLANRYDPWSFLPDDKTYEQWKEEQQAFIRETQEWWDRTYGRPERRKNKNNDYFDKILGINNKK